MTHPWPLWNLVLRTPRLELRPDDDAGLLELAAEASRGVHPPERMPFLTPWTDVAPEHLGRNVLQHAWKTRSELRPEHWSLQFLVRKDGEVIGSQAIEAWNFAVTREIRTGSWIGSRYQGQGFGTEMRAALLMFAFDHLGAEQARSDAFTDNTASLRVSDKLGYAENGSARYERRAVRADVVRLLLTPERFARPGWQTTVEGLRNCLPLLVSPTPGEGRM